MLEEQLSLSETKMPIKTIMKKFSAPVVNESLLEIKSIEISCSIASVFFYGCFDKGMYGHSLNDF